MNRVKFQASCIRLQVRLKASGPRLQARLRKKHFGQKIVPLLKHCSTWKQSKINNQAAARFEPVQDNRACTVYNPARELYACVVGLLSFGLYCIVPLHFILKKISNTPIAEQASSNYFLSDKKKYHIDTVDT